MSRSKWLVETDWLEDHLKAPDVVVIDGSYHLPAAERDPHREYLDAHIPGAIFFDIEKIADPDHPMPHMLPRPEMFSSMMRKMGIGDGQRIVVYDAVGQFSAARVWWMFRAMGCRDVAVLNGGLPKWRREGRAIEDGSVIRPPRHFTARLDHTLLRSKEDVLHAVNTGNATILDARSKARYLGSEPEPRDGLRAGHIPGSHSLHYAQILNEDGTFKEDDDLKAVFSAIDVDPAKPIVASCGSGVTAAIIALAQAIIGNESVAVYDGSWTEWGSDEALPIETGEAA